MFSLRLSVIERFISSTHFGAFFVILCAPVFVNAGDLQPPHSVRVDAQTEHSLTLSWDEPKITDVSHDLLEFSVHYFSKLEAEKEVSVAAKERTKFINGLQPGTDYTIYVTAHYSGNKSVSSPQFLVSTLEDPTNFIYRDCMCYERGTEKCDRLPSGGQCVCQPGYEGPRCDACSEGFYRSGELCLPCPCSKESSVGACELGTAKAGEVVCSCRPGYIGTLCDTCMLSYYPVDEWCVPCHCLFCRTNHLQQLCEGCPAYAHNFTNQNAVMHNCGLSGHPRSQQRAVSQGDGTVAIVAVVVSLAFIACVAGGITCYRRHMQAQNQPPFWSIELAEDKVSLNTNSDYQRLDGASSSKHTARSGHQRSPSVADATAAQRVADQPQYNCISI